MSPPYKPLNHNLYSRLNWLKISFQCLIFLIVFSFVYLLTKLLKPQHSLLKKNYDYGNHFTRLQVFVGFARDQLIFETLSEVSFRGETCSIRFCFVSFRDLRLFGLGIKREINLLQFRNNRFRDFTIKI